MEAQNSPDINSVKPQESEWPMGIRKTVEVNGRRWHYREYGNRDGRPTLNVHGIGSSADGQDPLSRSLAGEPQNSSTNSITEGIRNLNGKRWIISPDLPGNGKTPPLNNPTFGNTASELVDFMKAAGMENGADLIGDSAGAVIVTKVAAEYPEMAKTLVLISLITKPEDINRFVYLAGQIGTFKPIDLILKKLNLSKKLYLFVIKSSKDFKMTDKESQERIVSDVLSADVNTGSRNVKEIGKDIRKDIAKVQCPAVIIASAESELVPPLNAAKAADIFHDEIPSSEKVKQKKLVFLLLGGRIDVGHNASSTNPNELALIADDVLTNLDLAA